jgi:Domain of unknown function (DUF4232)
MRFGMFMAVAVGVAAAGFTLAGCTSLRSSSSSGRPAAATSATGPAAARSPGQAGNPAPSTASSQQAQAAGNGGTCQAANLSYTLGAKSYPLSRESGTTGQTTQAVDLTNKGSSACTLQGFPGVDLIGAANGQQDYTWPLVRQSASYQTVELQPGGIAHFNLVYLPSVGASIQSDDITVAKMVIRPPDGHTQSELTWNQSVVLQDGATDSGTYITPVVSGS